MTIRVALVDDQELIRTGLAMVVESAPDLQLVGQAGDGEQAVSLVARVTVDVVLMDIRMPRMDGIEATRRIHEASATTRVIALTTFDLDEYAYAALRAGASGFLLKDATAADVLAAIRAVHDGEAVLAPSTTRRMLDHLMAARPPVPDPEALGRLTAREQEVLTEIGAGHTNPQIAARLHLSEATVKTHVGRILAKLELRDRVQIVIFAYDHGLAVPRDRRQPP